MKWVRIIVEKWKRFMEETAKENEKMWKGESPSCCNRQQKQSEDVSNGKKIRNF